MPYPPPSETDYPIKQFQLNPDGFEGNLNKAILLPVSNSQPSFLKILL